MSREVELGYESWTSFASSCSSTASARTLSLWLRPSTAVETATAQCTSRWAMARGHRLNTSIVLAAVHDLSSLFQAVSAVESSLFRPPPPPPPPVPTSNKPPCICGRKAKRSLYGQRPPCPPLAHSIPQWAYRLKSPLLWACWIYISTLLCTLVAKISVVQKA